VHIIEPPKKTKFFIPTLLSMSFSWIIENFYNCSKDLVYSTCWDLDQKEYFSSLLPGQSAPKTTGPMPQLSNNWFWLVKIA
jgi:hypothetical protein